MELMKEYKDGLDMNMSINMMQDETNMKMNVMK